jgi:Clp amino terminal domain, pathogenicity island component
MFERYSEKARRVIFFARYECSQYGSPAIESEHLLLGLLRETALLKHLLPSTLGPPDVFRKEIETQIIIRPAIPTNTNIPLSAECKRILRFAADESEHLGYGHVEPEHLLVGLLREDQCLGARILQAREVTLSRVRQEARFAGPGDEKKPDARPYDSTDYREAWKRYRLLRALWVFIVLIELGPVEVIFARLLPAVVPATRDIVQMFVSFSLLFLIDWKIINWKCPRCGRSFFTGAKPTPHMRWLFLPRRCRFCGLSKYALHP